MKRRRDEEMEMEVEMELEMQMQMETHDQIKFAIEELCMFSEFKSADGAHIPTRPFLHLCNLVIQVLDKIGPTMAVLRQDITQNIQRLEMAYESDPSRNSNLLSILKKEAHEGSAGKRSSCSKAFVWLTRCLEFSAVLLQRLANNLEQNMEQAVEDSYRATLKPWHGWISSAAFKVALKLVPDIKAFISLLMPKHQNKEGFKEDLQRLTRLLMPVLQDIHSILKLYGLDSFKCT